MDRTTSSGIIDPAMAADIPVVFFNRQPVEEDLDRWDKLYYVGAGCQGVCGAGGGNRSGSVRKDPVSLDKNLGMALSAMYSWREKTIIRIP